MCNDTSKDLKISLEHYEKHTTEIKAFERSVVELATREPFNVSRDDSRKAVGKSCFGHLLSDTLCRSHEDRFMLLVMTS